MRWRPTKVRLFLRRQVVPLGDLLLALLSPSGSSTPVSKLRYAWQMFMATKRTDWRETGGISAAE